MDPCNGNFLHSRSPISLPNVLATKKCLYLVNTSLPSLSYVGRAFPTTRAFVCVFTYVPSRRKKKQKLLRRNCFVGVALDFRNTPTAGGGSRWASSGDNNNSNNNNNNNRRREGHTSTVFLIECEDLCLCFPPPSRPKFMGVCGKFA